MSQLVISQTPYRISLGGGGTDLPFYANEKGEQLKTHQLKDLIFNTQSKTITFMIGGTDGFSEQFLKKGNMVMSLSRMTLTHSFAAIILLEQIYRSVTIKINHPYHRR